MKQKIFLVRGDKQVHITTDEAYDHQTEEYVKISSNLIKEIYNNLAEILDIYELSQRPLKEDTDNQESIKIEASLLSKIFFSESNTLYFHKINPTIFEREFIMEMYLVATNDLSSLLNQCKKNTIHSFQEGIQIISKLASIVIAIYDSSDVYIYYTDETLLEKALYGLGENYLIR